MWSDVTSKPRDIINIVQCDFEILCNVKYLLLRILTQPIYPKSDEKRNCLIKQRTTDKAIKNLSLPPPTPPLSLSKDKLDITGMGGGGGGGGGEGAITVRFKVAPKQRTTGHTYRNGTKHRLTKASWSIYGLVC